MKLLLIILFVFSTNVLSKESIKSIRFAKNSSYSRIILDLSSPVQSNVFLLKNPNRLVVDLSHHQAHL